MVCPFELNFDVYSFLPLISPRCEASKLKLLASRIAQLVLPTDPPLFSFSDESENEWRSEIVRVSLPLVCFPLFVILSLTLSSSWLSYVPGLSPCSFSLALLIFLCTGDFPSTFPTGTVFTITGTLPLSILSIVIIPTRFIVLSSLSRVCPSPLCKPGDLRATWSVHEIFVGRRCKSVLSYGRSLTWTPSGAFYEQHVYQSYSYISCLTAFFRFLDKSVRFSEVSEQASESSTSSDGIICNDNGNVFSISLCGRWHLTREWFRTRGIRPT